MAENEAVPCGADAAVSAPGAPIKEYIFGMNTAVQGQGMRKRPSEEAILNDLGNREKRTRQLSGDHLFEEPQHEAEVTDATTVGYDSGEESSVEPGKGSVCLDDFAVGLLSCRKYSTSPIVPAEDKRRHVPTGADLEGYDMSFTRAVREGDVREVEKFLKEQGRSANTCNRFGESILHMAARNGHTDVVEVLLKHGASVWAVDDMNRTPLHDACWNPMSDLQIPRMLLSADPELIRARDQRGNTPLGYVNLDKEETWKCFLVSMVDICWPVRDDEDVEEA